MPTVTINGVEVTVPAGTNLIQAAEEAGFSVPFFCYHPALSAPANCRMCLVEVQGGRKLEPACCTPVRDGMVVHTESDSVKQARKAVLEFILVNHPVDCPICDQAGECWLQDNYLAYDAQPSRVRTEKVSKAKVFPIGPDIVYDGERCILCTRCIRFCDEVSETSELTVVERGDQSEIRTFPGKKLDNDYAMCTADLCPVGALTLKEFRFKRRVWLLQSGPTICTGCARGCNVHLDHYQDHPERYVPRPNPDVNEYWMCDAGRMTYRRLRDDRLTEIVVDGEVKEHWPMSLRPIAARVQGVGADGWGLVLSPQASVEGLAGAVAFAETCLGGAALFANGMAPGHSDEFLIQADKNPNTAGLQRVVGERAVGDTEALVAAIESGAIRALWMMDVHFPDEPALLQRLVAALARLDLFVLQSAWRGVFASMAHILLPAAAHAEAAGTYINCSGIGQLVPQVIQPQGDSSPDWQIFLRLSRGLRTPLPYTDLDSAAALAGLSAEERVEPVPVSREDLRAPHGPHRAIPGRSATPDPQAKRSPLSLHLGGQ